MTVPFNSCLVKSVADHTIYYTTLIWFIPSSSVPNSSTKKKNSPILIFNRIIDVRVYVRSLPLKKFLYIVNN